MIFYPKLYVDTILDIKYETLKENNIQAIILDMDNTIIDFDKNILKGAKQWCEELKNKGIKFLIVSNSNKEDKLKKVSNELEIDYIMFAMKPFKKGLKKAIKTLGINPENTAAIGDQVFTDVVGANRLKMFSILVKPLDEKDIWLTVIKRPLENVIIKRYKRRENK